MKLLKETAIHLQTIRSKRCRLENWVFLQNYLISWKWSATQQKQLHNDAFYVKTSQSAKN